MRWLQKTNPFPPGFLQEQRGWSESSFSSDPEISRVYQLFTSNSRYIYGKFSEPPAIFEIKDKQPALVAYDYEDGVYVIRKVVEQGQLRIGKKLMAFSKRVDGDL